MSTPMFINQTRIPLQDELSANLQLVEEIYQVVTLAWKIIRI